MQVDEPWTDDKARHVEDSAPRRLGESGADGGDHALGHEHVGNPVETSTRIDNTSTAQERLHASSPHERAGAASATPPIPFEITLGPLPGRPFVRDDESATVRPSARTKRTVGQGPVPGRAPGSDYQGRVPSASK
ncbi:hypothetical protein GCM10010174_72840 [Kutzneria viridogrisea]